MFCHWLATPMKAEGQKSGNIKRGDGLSLCPDYADFLNEMFEGWFVISTSIADLIYRPPLQSKVASINKPSTSALNIGFMMTSNTDTLINTNQA